MREGTELRCPNRKHAELVDGVLEIRCRKPACGYAPGIVVIHRFDAEGGELLDTKRFRDTPAELTKEGRG